MLPIKVKWIKSEPSYAGHITWTGFSGKIPIVSIIVGTDKKCRCRTSSFWFLYDSYENIREDSENEAKVLVEKLWNEFLEKATNDGSKI